MKYFSVKKPLNIGGKDFHTCICYEITDYLKKTVMELAERGEVEVYDKMQFFCNGKILTAVKKASKKTSKKEVKIEEPEELKAEITDETKGF